MKLLVCFLLVLFFSLNNNLVDAFSPTGTIDHEFKKPWHGMFLESDRIYIDLIVENKMNAEKFFIVELDLELVSDPEQSISDSLHINLESFEHKPREYRTSLIPGQWKLSLNLYENSTDCCHQQGYKTWFVVQPVQDYYSFLTIMAAIGTGSATTGALIATIIFSRRHVKSAQKQNEILLDSQKVQKNQVEELQNHLTEQRRIVKLAHLPHIIPRQDQEDGKFVIKSIQNIGNGPAKNIEVTIKKATEDTGISLKILGLTANQAFTIPEDKKIRGNINDEIEIKVKFDDVTDTEHDLPSYKIKIAEMTSEFPKTEENS